MASSSLDVGAQGSCAVLATHRVRCWGIGGAGQLGYGNPDDIGDDETPASAGPVNLGTGRTAAAITSGYNHNCAILDNGRVRCWGDSNNGELGYGNTDTIGDNETPGSVGPVEIGAGRTAMEISGGGSHTCVVLDNGRVRCWGSNVSGELGYGNKDDIGDDETPGSVGPVALGAGRTAVAITGGGSGDHTCAILDNGKVRCWGDNERGQLGYGSTDDIGDDETPASVGPVNLGPGRTAVALAIGVYHTCALLDTGKVRCWGDGFTGALGYGNTDDIGDDETPAAAGPVNLGAGRTAVAIAAGALHTCALLDNGRVRCWGDGNGGKLGYGNEDAIGDNETPGSVGPVDLGARVAAKASSELSLKAKPRRDRARPFKFRVSGEMGGFIPDPATCVGTVEIRAKRGSKGAGRAAANLQLQRAGCVYRARLKSTRRGRLRLTARFPGDTNLRSDRSDVVKVRAG